MLIYHALGGQFYDRTDPEECFATEADASAAAMHAIIASALVKSHELVALRERRAIHVEIGWRFTDTPKVVWSSSARRARPGSH